MKSTHKSEGPTMETQFTPGPWAVDTDTKDGAWTLVFDSAADLICDTAPLAPQDREACRSECESNARLIAAAPDLYAACEAAQEGTGDWRAMIDLALAKARGESGGGQ